MRDGDVLHVHSIDRLARNLMDLQKLVEDLTRRGVSVRFHKENLAFTGESSDPMQVLMLQMMGAFAQFERSLIRERQREGIAAAKAAGRHLGRKRRLTPGQIDEARTRRAAGESATDLAKFFGVSRATMYSQLQQAAPRAVTDTRNNPVSIGASGGWLFGYGQDGSPVCWQPGEQARPATSLGDFDGWHLVPDDGLEWAWCDPRGNLG